MQVKQEYSLRLLNTFGIETTAARYCELSSVADAQSLIQSGIWDSQTFILGGGSNVLFTRNIDTLVVKNNLLGIEIGDYDENHKLVTAQSGENWHDLVMFCLEHNLGGIENLSLIPGTVGAAPMQNIGAYGVELKNVFHSLNAINLSTGNIETFDKSACEFAYRESVFKKELKGQYFITSLTLKLSTDEHTIFSDYGAIKETLEVSEISHPGIKDISDAVISIRQEKLPDPAQIGNAGSFFKNPVIDNTDFEGLRLEFPSIPGYEVGKLHTKVPAGWLIEQCGWKGKRFGPIGVHENQALVLVNYGGGQGADIQKLAVDIKESVASKFGIELRTEVNII